MPPRILVTVLVAALTLVAGCLQDAGSDGAPGDGDDGGDGGNTEGTDRDGDDPGGADPPGTGDGDGKARERECPDLVLRADPESFRPGERVQFTLALENCANETVHVTLPYCAKPGEVEVALDVDGDAWYLGRGGLQPEPVDDECETFERSIAPGEAFGIPIHWDGRFDSGCEAMRCDDDAWAPHGAYRVTADVTSAEGDTWKAGSWVEFRAPDVPPYANDGEIVFLLEDEYAVGESVSVRVRNDGERTFLYRTQYAACDLEYSNATGYPFIIPPGTHCDIANQDTIAPGETVTLFTWKLEKCVRDNWGCSESERLPPGTYHVSGTFHEDVERYWENPDAATRAGATFSIT